MSGSSWMWRTMRIRRNMFNILIVCMLIIILFFRFMKSFCIEATMYWWLHKKHPQFTCEMKKCNASKSTRRNLLVWWVPFTSLLLLWCIWPSYQLNHASHGVRSDDSNGLLTKGLEYIDEKHSTLIPPISTSRPKADVQGFNHPMIVQLLCPINYIASFDENPEGYAPSIVLHPILFFFSSVFVQNS